MVKKVLRINLSIIFLILIVSIPLTFADWSQLTVRRDTNVVTYEELEFIRKNEPFYYIYYKNNKPYIGTKEDYYNIWNFNNIYQQKTNYIINKLENYVKIEKMTDGYIQFLIDVKPSTDYYFSYNAEINYTKIPKMIVETVTQSGSRVTVYDDYLQEYTEISFTTRPTTKRLRIRIYNNYLEDGQETRNIKIYNLWLNEGRTIKKPDIIDRPAETYVIEHTDYTQIGSIIVNSFNNFANKLLNPLDFLEDIFDSVSQFIKQFFKDILKK